MNPSLLLLLALDRQREFLRQAREACCTRLRPRQRQWPNLRLRRRSVAPASCCCCA